MGGVGKRDLLLFRDRWLKHPMSVLHPEGPAGSWEIPIGTCMEYGTESESCDEGDGEVVIVLMSYIGAERDGVEEAEQRARRVTGDGQRCSTRHT